MATAAKVVIAEVEEIVENGELDPDNVHVPGIFVSRIYKGSNFEKRIEKRTLTIANNNDSANGVNEKK
jgi:acyl CoA:acetate/3-ketoacid CoA transferase